MPHVLVAGKIHDVGKAALRAATEFTHEFIDDVTLEAYAPRVGDADAIILRTQPFRADLIARADKLQIVSRHGVGFDSVDVPALDARGIPLTVVGDVNSGSVAEHTLMLMLALAKKVRALDASTRAGDWARRERFETFDLAGRTLLLLGFGRIGRRVNDLARAFGMHVLAFDPPMPAEIIAAAGATPVADLWSALAAADFVSVHRPSDGGRPALGPAELAAMKPTAYVVNTARGGLVNEDALAAALAAGDLAGAALDVFAHEPPDLSQALFQDPRVIVSPHVAGISEDCARRMAMMSVRNVLDYFNGSLDARLVVNAQTLPESALARLKFA